MSASKGIAFGVLLIAALSICLLVAAVTTGNALTVTLKKPWPAVVVQELKEHPGWVLKGFGLIKKFEVLPNNAQGFGVWLVLTGVLAGAAAKGLVRVAEQNKETLAIPDEISLS